MKSARKSAYGCIICKDSIYLNDQHLITVIKNEDEP